LIAQHQLSMVMHHKSQLWDIEHARGVSPIDVWLKIDTGMHRLGFPPDQADEVLSRLKVCLSVGQVRLMTHLANADNKFDSTTAQQVERFSKAVGVHRLERSVANSAGIMSWPSTHMDWVRPGIMLYGGSPVTGVPASDLGLQPVMTLASEIIAVNERRAGETIGYGGDWTCPQDMPVGVVAIGYGDGYPRHAPAGTPVLVNGVKVPLIGRVSMDMIIVDLRNYPEAKIGDPVILWGHGLPVDEIAELAGTISYELLCHVAARVPRVETSG
jgi:alanine racemase